MSYLYDCAKKVIITKSKDKMIILESTVFPGATETVFNFINTDNKYNLVKHLLLDIHQSEKILETKILYITKHQK